MTDGLLLLRADASRAIGFGHVARCFALAEAWHRGPVVLRSHRLPAGLREAAEVRGVRVVDASTTGDLSDASETAQLAQNSNAPVVVDGYHFDGPFRKLLHERVAVCWIDDAGTLDDPWATVVVNQNLDARIDWYPAAPHGTTVLAGPRYALLRPSFAEVGRRAPHTEDRRVVITFGGSDPAGWSSGVLDALEIDREALGGDTAIAIVLGSGLPDADRLAARARALGIEPLVDVPSMATALAGATVVLAAAGTTVLELACLGRPAVLVTAAANQLPVADSARRAGLAEVSTGDAAEALVQVRSLLADDVRRAAMSHEGRSLVDGRGAERVAEIIGRG